MKRVFVLLLALWLTIFCVCVLSACVKKVDESTEIEKALIGVWKPESGDVDKTHIVFYEDGTCWVNYQEIGYWKMTGNKLSLLGAKNGYFQESKNRFIGTLILAEDTLTIESPTIDGLWHKKSLVYKRIS
ncbi:MAG: hypothetical protein E7637_05415 [Ruminococcaceae bacterium]|nr:hypothetical protein [Oscillospiraceae bacterium]